MAIAFQDRSLGVDQLNPIMERELSVENITWEEILSGLTEGTDYHEGVSNLLEWRGYIKSHIDNTLAENTKGEVVLGLEKRMDFFNALGIFNAQYFWSETYHDSHYYCRIAVIKLLTELFPHLSNNLRKNITFEKVATIIKTQMDYLKKMHETLLGPGEVGIGHYMLYSRPRLFQGYRENREIEDIDTRLLEAETEFAGVGPKTSFINTLYEYTAGNEVELDEVMELKARELRSKLAADPHNIELHQPDGSTTMLGDLVPQELKDSFSTRNGTFKTIYRYLQILLERQPSKGLTWLNSDEAFRLLSEEVESEEISQKLADLVTKLIRMIIFEFHLHLSNQLSKTKIEEIREAVIKAINFKEGGKRRERTAIVITGMPAAGKGTLLTNMGIYNEVSTGTAGISGRQSKHYESYEFVSGSFDEARKAGYLVPDNLIALWAFTEMGHQRQQLDNAGFDDKPLFLEGFPRNESQAQWLTGVNNLTLVQLNVARKTAIERQVGRIIESIIHEERGEEGATTSHREDDFTSLALDSKQVVRQELLKLLQPHVARKLKSKQAPEEEDVKALATSILQYKKVQKLIGGLDYAEGSRPLSLERAAKSVNEVAAKRASRVITVNTDELTPMQVLLEVETQLALDSLAQEV